MVLVKNLKFYERFVLCKIHPYKTSKIVFSRFIFTIYHMGIQGVRRSHRGLQGIKGGYKGLQGVTRRYRGLQRIIETLFQILFLGLFCIKIKVKEISNF